MATDVPLSTDQCLHEGTMQADGDHCDSGDCWCWDDRYMVVTRDSVKELMDVVNSFIHQKGWKPLGGIMRTETAYDQGSSAVLWAQAMSRHV